MEAIIIFILKSALGIGLTFLAFYLLFIFGNLRERIKELFNDIEKLKTDSKKAKDNLHRALNDVERIKQSLKKNSPEDYFKYWNK